MTTVVAVLKHSMHLGTITFVLVLLAVGLVVVVVCRTRRWPIAYFAAALSALWALATPAVAERLIATLETGAPPIARVEDARGADMVVVLGAGSLTFHVGELTLSEPTRPAIFRVIEAARLYRLLDRPTVVLSGGPTDRDLGAVPESEALREAALTLGIPAGRIVLESHSLNTRDEAVEIKRMFAGRAQQRFVLVTTATHMRRSIAAFRAVGLFPIASPAAEKSDGTFQTRRWLPNDLALELSDNVFYEWFALGYYRLRGWLAR